LTRSLQDENYYWWYSDSIETYINLPKYGRSYRVCLWGIFLEFFNNSKFLFWFISNFFLDTVGQDEYVCLNSVLGPFPSPLLSLSLSLPISFLFPLPLPSPFSSLPSHFDVL
jgi:hypothetical protein